MLITNIFKLEFCKIVKNVFKHSSFNRVFFWLLNAIKTQRNSVILMYSKLFLSDMLDFKFVSHYHH